MPRPFRRRALPACLAALGCAALGPATLHAALAACAGTLFEAAPFVLVAEALPGRRSRLVAAFVGCGCGRAVPGALSFAAIGLCWLTFGPSVAVARTAAGIVLLACRRPRARKGDEPGLAAPAHDALAELLALAPSAAAAAVLAGSVASHVGAAKATPIWQVAAFASGLALGCIAPCGTAAVALASTFAPHLPFAATGLLMTGGLAPRLPMFGRGLFGRRSDSSFARPRSSLRDGAPAAADRAAPIVRLALALALATLALSGPRGFINARLVPFEAAAAALALAGIRRGPASAGAAIVPAVLWLALAAGSPEPSFFASETRLDDAFAGERVTFTGVAHRAGASTIVQRFAITCCRIDASAVAVRTAAALAVPDGSWVRASGVFTTSANGLLLNANEWRRIAAPADPFVYR